MGKELLNFFFRAIRVKKEGIMEWDGQAIEDEKMMNAKLGGAKSRWSWGGGCMKFDCLARDKRCGSCFRIGGKESEYVKKDT